MTVTVPHGAGQNPAYRPSDPFAFVARRSYARAMAEMHASPELFPLAIDPPSDRVQFVRLSPADYERASFLDARLKAPTVGQAFYPQVAKMMAGAPIACDYIFHIGHVGSTLLSRLLGYHPRVFSLREPQALRTFAQRPWADADLDARLATFQALFSRTWTPEQRALVKATSMVCTLADQLMARNPGGRAICMTVPLERYLPTILSGANLGDVQQAAPVRLPRLLQRLGDAAPDPQRLTPGELIALSWLSDMADLTEMERNHPGRVLWIDFDRFLADPRAGVAASLQHLGASAETPEVERIMQSGYLERYSKAPEYGYSPSLRREVLDTARQDNAAEIERGLALYGSLAGALGL